MTQVKTFTFGPYQANSYVCYSGKDAVLVDATAYFPGEHRAVEAFLREEGLVLRHLLLTHAHLDHIFGCAHFAYRFAMRWHAHPDCLPFLENASLQATMYGMAIQEHPLPAHDLYEGNVITFGETSWDVLHTPGHAPGSVCFYDSQAGFALVGDVLFQGSIGRHDLPGGNLQQLMASIHQKLLTLPGETVIYPGHGPSTTVDLEKEHNPFLTS